MSRRHRWRRRKPWRTHIEHYPATQDVVSGREWTQDAYWEREADAFLAGHIDTTAPGVVNGNQTAIPAVGAVGAFPVHQHRGDPIRVGPHTIYAGGVRDLRAGDLDGVDVLVPLLSSLPRLVFGQQYRILAAPLVDYGGVPGNWEAFLRGQVIPLLEEGLKVLAFCYGSHGRTGVFLASLIAILESKEETPDPIATARDRHCHRAVESLAQATAVFAIRGEELPQKYVEEFAVRRFDKYYGKGGYAGFYPHSNKEFGSSNW